MVKLDELRYELFDNTPYSLDLAPSDYNPYLNLKRRLIGRLFHSNEDFDCLEKDYYLDMCVCVSMCPSSFPKLKQAGKDRE
ncbi:hypothetical protein CEXT_472381 [Caerostris extrusa]|uniref:Uncharacterized protein n=1 Tax=Caerostris extrusa TaxID=172846 RepID=A0AAV4X002_CAEEX|nr:hypothetical protein CEXT_472381 [Caerostris extrusa]